MTRQGKRTIWTRDTLVPLPICQDVSDLRFTFDTVETVQQ